MEAEMALEKRAKSDATEQIDANTPADVPEPLSASTLEVGNLEEAAEFYGKLFWACRPHASAGSRCYFTCGPVTLQIVDVSSVRTPHPAAKALYFVVNDLDAIFERARSLGCLSQEEVHGSPAGKISVQPWGERSFYALDRWHNPLCFDGGGYDLSGLTGRGVRRIDCTDQRKAPVEAGTRFKRKITIRKRIKSKSMIKIKIGRIEPRRLGQPPLATLTAAAHSLLQWINEDHPKYTGFRL